jgi:hypothetical protein
LVTCCEKIPLIKLNCPEEDMSLKPQLFGVGRCSADVIKECISCKGVYFNPISDWVACRLESVATFFNMLDFEFYNDWMNGSLYFPLIKRKLKIKKAKKAAKGKSLKRGQGQVKKDVFCDYDCDGGNNEPDYQFPDDVELYSVKIRGGGVQDLTFDGCKATLPRRISAKQWYDDVNKVYRTIEFKGNYVDDISKGCTFTLEEYCNSDGVNCPTGETDIDGVEIGNTGKFIKVKKRIVPGPHGKPKYIKIGAGSDGDGKRISIWENVGGHGHHKNKCKKNYFIEKEEYTKTDLSDCRPISLGISGDTGIGGITVDSDPGDSENDCAMSCAGQGAMACSRDCACDNDKYNEDPNYRGVIKWEDGEIYYVSIKDNRDSEEDKSDDNTGSETGFGGQGNFDAIHYKKNMFFPTNITELGSSVFCDIDEAPFLIDDLEPTTYKVSEEELKVSTKGIPSGVNVKYRLQEKEGVINLRSYVDFGCIGVKCMNIRSSVVQSQVGTELFDTNDTGLECGSCKSYVDVDTDIRQYFCQRFSTFVPSVSTDGETITDMKVNYIRPGGSQGENYYEPYNDITGRCDTFDDSDAIVDGGTNSIDVIAIDNEVNDNELITPGDKCGYLTTNDTGLDFTGVTYFYAMDLTEEHTKQDLKSFPFEGSKLGSGYTLDIDVEQNPILVNDDEGISLFSTQTPYFFYFGLVPGKTALNKVVGKFFADKINAETLETISNGGTNETIVPPNSNKSTSPQSIVGSCVNS